MASPEHVIRVLDRSSRRWYVASLVVDGDRIVVGRGGCDTLLWMAHDICSVTELAPFGGPVQRIEVEFVADGVCQLELTRDAAAELVAALMASLDPDAPTSTERPSRWIRPRWAAEEGVRPHRGLVAAGLVVALSAVLLSAVLSHWSGSRRHEAAAATDSVARATSPGPTAERSTPLPRTDRDAGAASTTTAPPAPPPPPEPTAIAPLTGLPVPVSALARNAIVAKIDASEPAMPQVGMDQADLVVEVKIEFDQSRYLAVFHSRQAEIIGPHRSARTTDPDLLSLFGHPLFAFSGANEGVVDDLALSGWKTGVGPAEVPAAWFRDESRPWPHNLFATSSVLRSRPAPAQFPEPLFSYRRPGSGAGGVPVAGMSLSVGAAPSFAWDPMLGGWRRQVHGRDHLHASGAPVAPTNVVVLGTFYGTSVADARSPEAVSLGLGEAWVFSEGRVVQGIWARPDRSAPYSITTVDGAAITLVPGQTWVVLADEPPVIDPPG